MVLLLHKAMDKSQMSQGPWSLQRAMSEGSPVEGPLLLWGGQVTVWAVWVGSSFSPGLLPLSPLPFNFSPLPTLMSLISLSLSLPAVSLVPVFSSNGLLALHFWLSKYLLGEGIWPGICLMPLPRLRSPPTPTAKGSQGHRASKDSSVPGTLEKSPFRGLHSLGPARSSQ